MIVAQALNLTFEKLALDRSCPLVVALRDEKISQGRNCPEAQILIPAEVASQIANRFFH